jgi:hypothetical protein
MTNLSLTSILFVSILVEEVKAFCFASKSAWVIPSPVEEIVFLEIVMFVPPVKVFCFLFSSLSTYIQKASLSSEFIAACNPDVLAKDKSPSFIIFCFVSKSA